MHVMTPYLPSKAPKDGREFIGEFRTEGGPKTAIARFAEGKLQHRKGGHWFDAPDSATLQSWGDYDPSVTYGLNNEF